MQQLTTRIGAACGGAFFALTIVGNEVLGQAGQAPPPGAGAAEQVAFLELRRASGTFDLAVGLELLGLLALLVFVVTVADRVRRAGAERAATVAIAGAATLIAAKFASGPAVMVAVSQAGELAPELAALLVMLNQAAFATTVPLFGVVLLAVAIGGASTASLPRPVTYGGAAVGVAALATAVALGSELLFLPMLLAMLWILGTSVTLAVRPAPRDRPEVTSGQVAVA